MKELDGKTIAIKCETKDSLNIAEMTELQGNLKHREQVDYDKIKLSIIKYGFSFPFFCWKGEGKNYILDGHGRFATLCKMQKDGYLIPDLPVVYIECSDISDAKQKLLRLNSQFGKMSRESVLEFASDIELNFDEIALPDSVIDFSTVENMNLDNFFDENTPSKNTDDDMRTFTIKVYEDKTEEIENILKQNNIVYTVK